MFFSFDGIDGVGKSTQIAPFCQWLEARGQEVVTCRDPGSTALGEAIRNILLDAEGQLDIHARSEMLLYMAARAQLVEEVIQPALDAGKTVVSDRFLLANVVYQGHAGGLDIAELWEVGRVATAGVEPELVFLLDMEPAAARARLGLELDRMEQRDEQYRRRLREGFLEEARRRPNWIKVIDGSQDVNAVQDAIRHIAAHLV